MLHHPGDVVMIAAGVVVLNASSTVEAGAVVIAVLPGGQAIAVPAAVVSAAGITAGVVLVGLGATGLTGHAATDDRITVMNSERSGLNGGKKGGADAAANSTITSFPDKAAARQAFSGDMQAAANRFFRDATSKSRDFQV
jgi:hypothetical protein